MGKNKLRKEPDKLQNKYGGDYDCPNFDKRPNGAEWCHDEGQVGWDEFIKWSKAKDGKLKCKGNRHNCMKLRQQWLASLSDKKGEKHLSNFK